MTKLVTLTKTPNRAIKSQCGGTFSFKSILIKMRDETWITINPIARKYQRHKINVVSKKQSSMFRGPLEAEDGVGLAEKGKITRRKLCIGKAYKSKL